MNIIRFIQHIRNQKKIHTYLIIGLIAMFLLLTAFVLFVPTTVLDYEFSEEVQEDHNPFLDSLMKGISWFGGTWVSTGMILITALLFLLFKYKLEALFILLTSVTSAINFGIKILINRPRPTKDFVRTVIEAKHNSFPSGHTSFYVAFFGFLLLLMLYNRKIPNSIRFSIIILSLLLIFAVPFSRVYLGVHWLTDVTAGFILGLIILYILIRIYLRYKKPQFKPE